MEAIADNAASSDTKTSTLWPDEGRKMDAVEDLEGDVGPLDIKAMQQIQDVFLRDDGLVEESETGFDSLLDPKKLVVYFTDGIGDADWCRFDIKWRRSGYYNFHYVDSESVSYRFDYHPKPDAPDRHFHPPPEAPSSDVEESCIEVEEPVLVARAIHQLWRRAYETGSFKELNIADNPP